MKHNRVFSICTHIKIVFGKIQKQFCPSKVLGAFCPGITAAKIWFFVKPKTKSVLIYTPVILSAFLFLSVLCSKEAGAHKSDSAFGEKIAGTYILTEDDDGGSRIVTITADGGWLGIHSLQFENKFSNQQGVWEKTGKRKIAVRTLDFISLKGGVGSALFNFTVEFDNAYQQVSGELSGQLFPPGVDPLDPVAAPIRTFNNTFTGKRLIVTDN
ncbi:MAG: hypothetical protein MAG551_00426 [Candidatus Scalindua arabica]|uniref:Uncharacterized protein n=1 Tax=Candidatus Scalindua arabica TaxID=1127984 RepID=A0A942A2W9_9BACT|nr:hypothetical protein [Candidatus Scalindua arabica]